MAHKVWFVDDLPRNLRRFTDNHRTDFEVSTFSRPNEVLELIHKRKYPDALLCDIFFYDTPEEAERVESIVDDLAKKLKQTALEIGVNDHRYAAGITLMKNIYEYFGNKAPPFPMYAYTSKGPFLLEQSDWNNISKYGAEVLLKNRVTPENERLEILGDIAIAKAKRSWLGWINTTSRKVALALIMPILTLLVGRYLRGHW
jgi:hypothetical protein